MAQEIETSSAPRSMSLREAEAKIAVLHGRLEEHPALPNRYCVRREAAATTAEHRQLCAVRDRLEDRLQPCADDLEIEALISQFLIGFEHGRGTSELNTAALNERYVKVLRKVPLAAIEAAIDRFDGAETLLPWNRAFRPTPAEFAAEAREGLIGLRRLLVHVRRVIDAEVYDPPTQEQLDAVAALARDYTEQRRAFDAQGKPNAVVADEDFEERLKARGSLKGLKLSDEALACHRVWDEEPVR